MCMCVDAGEEQSDVCNALKAIIKLGCVLLYCFVYSALSLTHV